MPADTPIKPVATITLNPALDLTLPLPELHLGEVNKAAHFELRPAGKGVNVAAMLAILGVPVSAGGLLPADDAPLFARFLAELNVGNAFEVIPGRTRINVKLVESALSRVTDINATGAHSPADGSARAWARLAATLSSPGIVALSGSLPPGLVPDAWAGMVMRAHAAGHQVVLDTSGPALPLALAAGPDAIKPNREELAAFLGSPIPNRAALIEAAESLRAGGIARVVVSDGAEGALFLLPEGRIWARPPKVTLTTTVGAGDAMVAGLCAAMARGLGAGATARLATAAAAAAVSRPQGGMTDLATIDRLAASVSIEVL